MDTAERYRKVAATFSGRVRDVPAGAWGNGAPCEGWVARDVVRHLVEWVPAFLPAEAGVVMPQGASVDDDPAAAWAAVDAALQAALDDPAMAAAEFDSRAGRHTVEAAIAMFILPDVLIHTWDLARATGLDETLDAGEVHDLLVGMEPHDEMLRQSGHYGPRVEVAADADEQTKLIAFTGRRP
jgi:uncharacterized protein (TIGR03086 family)